MAYIRLLEDHNDDEAGDLVYRPATVARSLVHNGIAVDGDDIYNYGPHKEEAIAKEYEKRGKHLTELPDGFPDKERLEDNGFTTVEAINEASDAELTDIKYIGPESVKDIREAAQNT